MKALVLEDKGSLDNLKVVNDRPIPRPGPTQLLVRTLATGINPIDWKMALYGVFIKSCPIVLGCDGCGQVIEKGNQVTDFNAGDIVYGLHYLGEPDFGPFAEYCLIESIVAKKKPDNLTPEQAAALPVAAFTSILALFLPINLGLSLQGPHANDSEADKTVLVWGGSSAVGWIAIQFLAALGYHVLTTASGAQVANMERLGAHKVFDYRQDDVVHQIKEYTHNQLKYCFDCVGDIKATEVFSGPGKVCFIARFERPEGLAENVTHSVVNLGACQHFPDILQFISGPGYAFLLDQITSERLIPHNLELFYGIDQLKAALLRQQAGVSGAKVVVSFSE